jgi:hypothetical protein
MNCSRGHRTGRTAGRPRTLPDLAAILAEGTSFGGSFRVSPEGRGEGKERVPESEIPASPRPRVLIGRGGT